MFLKAKIMDTEIPNWLYLPRYLPLFFYYFVYNIIILQGDRFLKIISKYNLMCLKIHIFIDDL